MALQERYLYDIALSFAGEDRQHAEALAEALRQQGLKVFYDKYEQSTLWGENLYDYLSNIYQKQAHFCVMFISRHYAMKLWTNLERQAAQARAFKERSVYILPIQLDDTEIPGLLPTIAYLKWGEQTIESIANDILRKLRNSNISAASSISESIPEASAFPSINHSVYETFLKEREALLPRTKMAVVVYTDKELAGKEVRLDDTYTSGPTSDHKTYVAKYRINGQVLYAAVFPELTLPSTQYHAWISDMPQFRGTVPVLARKAAEIDWRNDPNEPLADSQAHEMFLKNIETALPKTKMALVVYAEKVLVGKEVRLDTTYTAGSVSDHKTYVAKYRINGQVLYAAIFFELHLPSTQYHAWISDMPQFRGTVPVLAGQVAEIDWT